MSFGRRSRFASRAGFTLVELLVVISIIGMLMALLFPAINAARESGRQNTCRNNIRSIGQGLAQFENVKNVYPQIRDEKKDSDDNVVYSLPLMHQLFPFMDRMDLYRHYDDSGYPANSAQAPYLEYMQCPSNPKGDTGAVNAFVFNVGTVEGRTPNQSVTQNGKTAAEKYAGMFFDVGQISSSELVDGDGTTNTLMISENLDAGPWTSLAENRIGFTWFYPNANDPDLGYNGINNRKGLAQIDTSDPLGELGLWAPTANHPMLVNVAFADGHVRTLNDAIGYDVYVQLCTPRGARFGFGPLREGY